eukprot:355326-Rhodomonas_salina.1
MSCKIITSDNLMNALDVACITTNNDIEISILTLQISLGEGLSMHKALKELFPEANECQLDTMQVCLVSYCESVTAAEPATAALLHVPETWAAKAAKATEAAPKAAKRQKSTGTSNILKAFDLVKSRGDGNCLYYSLLSALKRLLGENHQ